MTLTIRPGRLPRLIRRTPGLEFPHQSAEPSLVNQGVRIQEHNIIAACAPDTEIVARSESQIGTRLNQLNPGESSFDRIRAPVIGGIVYNDNFDFPLSALLYRLQA